MTFRLFDAPEHEPSAFVGFAGNRIDRQAENRSDDCVARALADPAARLMALREGRVFLARRGEAFDPWYSAGDLAPLGADPAGAVLLGYADGAPRLAVAATVAPDDLPRELAGTIKAIDHRSVYVQGLISPADLGALAQGASLLAWHAACRFCGRCGQPTEMRIGGYKRVCTGCQAEHFPRTDPVAIMLAVRRDKALLGRGRHFAPGMFSALAGFIEPGETIEAAVRRETFEEAGIRLGRVVYHASQPWPFPHTLMIGCFGEALNDDILADMTELEACRWFSHEEVRAALEKRHPDGIFVPPAGAIAHHLIRAWAEAA